MRFARGGRLFQIGPAILWEPRKYGKVSEFQYQPKAAVFGFRGGRAQVPPGVILCPGGSCDFITNRPRLFFPQRQAGQGQSRITDSQVACADCFGIVSPERERIGAPRFSYFFIPQKINPGSLFHVPGARQKPF